VPIEGLTAYAHVAEVQRSIDFYSRLGLGLRKSYEDEGALVGHSSPALQSIRTPRARGSCWLVPTGKRGSAEAEQRR
jgi:hypothetical protein